MVLAQPGDGGDAVDERHVQVDHDRVGLERVGELDRCEAVGGDADDGQLGLVLDQRLERLEETGSSSASRTRTGAPHPPSAVDQDATLALRS